MRTEVKVFSVATGNLPENVGNALLSQLPNRSRLYSDEYQLINLFHFKHYNLHFLALNMDGQQIPAKAFKPKFSEK